jgi:GNAT superfamily N-acetyltransferase
MSEIDSAILLDHRKTLVSEAIFRLFQRSYKVEAKLLGMTDFPPLRRTAQHIKSSNTCFVAYSNGETLTALIEIELVQGQLDINSLVVDPEQFRKGYGMQLLHHVLSTLDWTKAVVETAQANLPAIALYEKFGFTFSRKWQTEEAIDKVQLCLYFNPYLHADPSIRES